MISIDEKDLQAVIDIAARAVKSQAEARLLEIVTAKWQAKVNANSNTKTIAGAQAGSADKPAGGADAGPQLPDD